MPADTGMAKIHDQSEREREERKGKERRKGSKKEKKEGGREGLNECVCERERMGVCIYVVSGVFFFWSVLLDV